MQAWRIHRHGGVDVLQLDDLESPKASSNEVKVLVRAVGLNHLDLWVRKGVEGHRFPLPIIPGCDIAGELEDGSRVLVNPLLSCGECTYCKSDREPLCREFGILGETTDGGCAEEVVVPRQNIVALPDEVSFETAAALPIPYMTALQMLTTKGRLQSGDLVLIQAGGSGVSVAAIQMAKHLGAEVITTVGSESKAEKAKELGADHVILYRETDFKKAVRAITRERGRRGVDIVIDHVGADTFNDSLRCLDWGGRLVTCGATTGSSIQMDLKPIFFKNIEILGSTMGSLRDLKQVLQWVSDGVIRPVVDSSFSMSELSQAHSYLESRQAFGKVVVTQSCSS